MGERGNMTETDAKEFIQSYKKLESKKYVLNHLKSVHSMDNLEVLEKEYHEICLKIQMIEASLAVLKEQEREVIDLHLIKNYTWNEIMDIFEKQYGIEHIYSERTFKRIQKKALLKIYNFLEEMDMEMYVS